MLEVLTKGKGTCKGMGIPESHSGNGEGRCPSFHVMNHSNNKFMDIYQEDVRYKR